MTVLISGIGLATAQGNAADIVRASEPHSPADLPWTPNKWNVSRICYPSLEIDSSLAGLKRWQELVKHAFAELGALSRNTPLLVASCNGDASRSWETAFETTTLLNGTPWSNEHLPVFSSSCASGIHALYAAKQLLTSGAVDEVLVLAADVLSQSNHENFESLRVLAEQPGSPWQSASQGFILGEAAVVLKLVRAETDDRHTLFQGPELASDLVDRDGLSSVLEALSFHTPSLILGQGTGPFQNDTAELSAFSAYVNKSVPLATPLSNFGHTLGASGLLAVALGVLSKERGSAISSLTGPAVEALDGRPLLNSAGKVGDVLLTCRALNGACAASVVGSKVPSERQRRKGHWRKSIMPGPLMNQTLKRLASEALEHRPSKPPDVFILRMEKPLSPRPSAIIGDRLLPSAVLEITPGFASQLVARCWGFSGPALCLVGDVDRDAYGLRNALHESGLQVFQVNMRGSGDNRAIEWNV